MSQRIDFSILCHRWGGEESERFQWFSHEEILPPSATRRHFTMSGSILCGEGPVALVVRNATKYSVQNNFPQ